MLCEQCGINEAEIIIKTIINGNICIRHLCKGCASACQKGDISGLLQAILAAGNKAAQGSAENDKVCAECGLTWADFKQGKLLGCPGCYNAFRDELNGIFAGTQYGTRHIGVHPVTVPEDSERLIQILKLKCEMSAAVENEDYRKAAVLRDRLLALEEASGEVEKNA